MATPRDELLAASAAECQLLQDEAYAHGVNDERNRASAWLDQFDVIMRPSRLIDINQVRNAIERGWK